MQDTPHQTRSIAAAQPRPQHWSERAVAALSRFHPRLARAKVELLVTLAVFTGVGLLSSLVLMILDHQLNAPPTTL